MTIYECFTTGSSDCTGAIASTSLLAVVLFVCVCSVSIVVMHDPGKGQGEVFYHKPDLI